jgi:lipid-A-disaccharide synthase
MVVSYRMSPITYAIISRMLKTEYVSLPNLLANESLVPELLQDSVKAEELGPHLLRSLEDLAYRDHLHARFSELSALIRMDSDASAALAVDKLIETRS